MLPDWSFLQSIKYTLRVARCPVMIEEPCTYLNVLLYEPFIEHKETKFGSIPFFGMSDKKYRIGKKGSSLKITKEDTIVEESFDYTQEYSVSDIYVNFGGWPREYADMLEDRMARVSLSFDDIINSSREANGDFGELIGSIDIYAKKILELSAPESLRNLLDEIN